MLGVLTIFTIFLTLVIVIAGNVVMVIGGKVSRKWSNKLMIMRVKCQAIAILMLFLFMVFN